MFELNLVEGILVGVWGLGVLVALLTPRAGSGWRWWVVLLVAVTVPIVGALVAGLRAWVVCAERRRSRPA